MSAKWNKLGLIFRPDSTRSWSRSHASAPVPLLTEDGLCRVYYSSRDEHNRSHVGYFQVDLNEPTRVISAPAAPVLSPGPLGHFDDHGIYASSVVRDNDVVRLYTIGWNPGPRPPLFYSSIGMAVSHDGGLTFRKWGASPIMARSDFDPCLVTAPVVRREGDHWKMWYVSGYRWDEREGTVHSCYHIKYAHSKDGVEWKREGVIAIDHASEKETNISRIGILWDPRGYRAWYGFDGGEGYRIGYAESSDGIAWRRFDHLAGLELSREGWDSSAISYPAVVSWSGRLFMFYNGNQFGHEGVGLAIADA